MRKLIIDRFEGVYAVCENEDKSIENVPKYKLPREIKEGDCLIQRDDGNYVVDDGTTKERDKKIRSKMNRLFD
jgi:hypothetical protein